MPHFFEDKYGFKKPYSLPSCTDALEMCAILLDIKAGDEVIVPSLYLCIHCKMPFYCVAQNRYLWIAKGTSWNGRTPNRSTNNLKTKAIVVVHYAGVACNMDVIMNIANRHNLFVVEDAHRP